MSNQTNHIFGTNDVCDIEEKENNTNEKCGTCGQNLWGCFKSYSSATSVHGVQYLAEDHRPYWERIFWILIFVISIYGCTRMIYSEWKRWNETPVIVTFSEKETDIWKIPFPAVTICPEFKVGSYYYHIESSLTPFMPALIHVCDKNFYESKEHPSNKSENFDVFNLLKQVSPTIFFNCKWQNNPINCSEIINEVLTEDGLCYNFNGLSRNDMFQKNRAPITFNSTQTTNYTTSNWDRENGYKTLKSKEAFPKYAIGSGRNRGLDITIHQYIPKNNTAVLESNVLCRDLLGYKVLIHSPDNIARIQSRHFYLPYNKKTIAGIKPSATYTSEELRSYSPEKRNCHFNGEMQLEYFKPYTQINCETECAINYIMERCGCVKFSMPSLPGVPICETIEDLSCYTDTENILLKNELLKRESPTNSDKTCECLPSCSSIEYNVEISNADSIKYSRFNKFFKDNLTLWPPIIENLFIHDNESRLAEQIDSTHLTIFFKENSFLSSKRSELYGLSSFLSNCGGLLGLFMGVSALSFVEFFYFSVIRLVSNSCKRKYKKAPQNDRE